MQTKFKIFSTLLISVFLVGCSGTPAQDVSDLQDDVQRVDTDSVAVASFESHEACNTQCIEAEDFSFGSCDLEFYARSDEKVIGSCNISGDLDCNQGQCSCICSSTVQENNKLDVDLYDTFELRVKDELEDGLDWSLTYSVDELAKLDSGLDDATGERFYKFMALKAGKANVVFMYSPSIGQPPVKVVRYDIKIK